MLRANGISTKTRAIKSDDSAQKTLPKGAVETMIDIYQLFTTFKKDSCYTNVIEEWRLI